MNVKEFPISACVIKHNQPLNGELKKTNKNHLPTFFSVCLCFLSWVTGCKNRYFILFSVVCFFIQIEFFLSFLVTNKTQSVRLLVRRLQMKF